MKKRLTALFLCSVFLLLCACGGSSLEVKPNNTQAANPPAEDSGGKEPVSHDPITLTLLSITSYETQANCVRDMLVKEGFNVEMNIQANAQALREQAAAGNYDIIVFYQGNTVRVPDYAAKCSFYTGGSDNYTGIADAYLDELVDTAAASSREEWPDTYGVIEAYVTDEMVYQTAFSIPVSCTASSKVMDYDSLHILGILHSIDYVDQSLRDSRTYVQAATSVSLKTIDPVRDSGPTLGTIATNIYTQLINLDDKDTNYEWTTDGTLSRSYAITEDNQNFYFLLRDDCFFSRVDENAQAYVTDQMVAAEDVVYTVNRIADSASAPNHLVSNYYNSVAGCEIVTDMDELKNAKTSTGESVYDVLNAGAKEGSSVDSIVATRDEVDNDAGSYQVVCIRTKYPFVQIMSYLSQHCAGILDSEWVESINSQVDFAGYNADTDVLYGDANTFYKDKDFYNSASCSGPYVLLYMDDYGVYLQKNEGWYTDEGGAKITYFNYMSCEDKDATVTMLRTGTADMTTHMNVSSCSIIEDDPNLQLRTMAGGSVEYVSYNINNPDSPCSNILIRKAIAAAINPADIIATEGGYSSPAYSVLSSTVNCGNTKTYEAGATEQYLAEYWASIS